MVPGTPQIPPLELISRMIENVEPLDRCGVASYGRPAVPVGVVLCL